MSVSAWTLAEAVELAFGQVVCLEPEEGEGGRPVRTFFLEGELGQNELRQLGDELERLFRLGEREVILDLGDVGHLDYRGVRALVKRVESLRRLGAEVKLSAVSPYLLAILRVSGAHGVFEIYDAPEKARQAFEEQAQQE